MAGSGSEKRRRKITFKVRATEEEAALIREQAARAGVSVASVFRYGVFDQPPLRKSRQPTINEELGSQLLGMLGRYTAALKLAAARGTPGLCDEEVKAVCRDNAELRRVWFEAFGKEP